MRVSDIMTTDVVCCRLDETLDRAAQLMWDHDCGAVPVVDNLDEVIGIVTDRDACMAAYTRGVRLADVRVGDVMSVGVETCRPGDSLQAAEGTMRVKQVRRLPVVEDGRLVGILSLNDIALARARGEAERGAPSSDEVADTLAGVSRHPEPRSSATSRR